MSLVVLRGPSSPPDIGALGRGRGHLKSDRTSVDERDRPVQEGETMNDVIDVAHGPELASAIVANDRTISSAMRHR